MYTIEVDPTLCRIIELYRRVGVWRKEDESHWRTTSMRILYFFHFASFGIYILSGVYDAYLRKDMNQLTFLGDIQIGVMVIAVKLAYLLWRKDKMLKFLYDPIVAHCTEDYRESVETNKKIQKISVFYKVYTRILFFNLFFMLLLPLPMFSSDAKMLPAFIRFNWESEYDMVFYWMMYLYGSIGCICCLMYSFTVLFLWYIMYNYAIEYNLLGQRFWSLGTKTPNTYQQDLNHLILAHNNLFDTIEQFRSCFTVLFFVEITTSAIFICLSTYNLSFNTEANFFEMAIYVAFLLYAFFEIFITMYLANEITLKSDRLSYCLFESNWIDQSKSTKNCIIILCEIIKQPQQLAIFIYPMNLRKFTSIVNGAYSLFNIMKNFK